MALVVAFRLLDVHLLPDLCTFIMEEATQELELITKYFADFTSRQLEQLQALGPLYREWNAKINVISRKDIDSLYEKHILHSLSIAAAFEFKTGADILDLGTGGGFPGIPLAIFFPDVRFLLVDSIGKKLKVVEAVASGIGLSNVNIQHGRAEAIHQKKFDYVVSRAVAPLGDLCRWSKPLIRKSSTPEEPRRGLICLKGGDLTQEIADSGHRPRMVEIRHIFNEPFFADKLLLQAPL